MAQARLTIMMAMARDDDDDDDDECEHDDDGEYDADRLIPSLTARVLPPSPLPYNQVLFERSPTNHCSASMHIRLDSGFALAVSCTSIVASSCAARSLAKQRCATASFASLCASALRRFASCAASLAASAPPPCLRTSE